MATLTLFVDGVQVGDELLVASPTYVAGDPQVLAGYLHPRGQIDDASRNATWRYAFVVTQVEDSHVALLAWHAGMSRLRERGPVTVEVREDGSAVLRLTDYVLVSLSIPTPASPARSAYTWEAEVVVVGAEAPEFL